MNIAPVSIRMLLNPLTRPMAMKAPRHDASAAPSSERAEAAPAAAGGNRAGAALIKKTCYLHPLLPPPARAIVHQSTGQWLPDGNRLRAREFLFFSARPPRASLAPDSQPPARRLQARSREVKIALVLNELRDGDVLDRDAMVGVGRDHRAPMTIIVCSGQPGLEICQYLVIDFDHIVLWVEIRDAGVAEISRKHERVAIGCGRFARLLGHRAGLRTVAGGIAGCSLGVRCHVARAAAIPGSGFARHKCSIAVYEEGRRCCDAPIAKG